MLFFYLLAAIFVKKINQKINKEINFSESSTKGQLKVHIVCTNDKKIR